MGIEIRAGLHTGEIELDDGSVRGIAVHIGSRVAGMAEASEVLVSSTVRDLVAGSALEFEDRGEHALKGVPGEWRLYRVVA
jgi:class 3 adenylate cyclase